MKFRVPVVVMRRRRYAALVDALRRSTELLDENGVGEHTPYHYEEVRHIRRVNFRLLREVDPKSRTDRTVA